MLARALDVVFPRRCAGCSRGPWPFCDACVRALEPIERPWCARCGAPSLLPVPRCRDCPPSPIATVRAPFRYEGPAREAIHRLKFTGWRDVAAALASAIAACDDQAPADVITWVPLSRRRLAERGYDQARALAVALAHETETPVARLLRRTIATGPQARRLGPDRRRAMRGAFTASRDAPARVLLVDDVLTTGATAAACAEALLASGAREVHVAVAARAVRALPPAGRGAYPRVGPRPGLWLPGDHPR
jgi:ComF family protein